MDGEDTTRFLGTQQQVVRCGRLEASEGAGDRAAAAGEDVGEPGAVDVLLSRDLKV